MAHRLSHARSCAMLMGQEYKVRRSMIIDLVRRACGVDLMSLATEADMGEAIRVLDQIKAVGLDAANERPR